jgi:hypothetical protein
VTDTPARPHDYSALTAAVNRADVAAFRTRMRATKGWSAFNVGSIVGLAFAVVFGIGLVVSLAANVVRSAVTASLDDIGTTAASIGFSLIVLAVIAGVILLLARSAFGLGSWVKWYRLSRFAEANGFDYSRTAGPDYPGAIFDEGTEREVTDLLRRASHGAIDRRTLDIGNYSYVTGSGKSSTTHRWGFVAIGLDRTMPNMVLDSRANNGLFGSTNLPDSFSRDQVLSLEGDFDRYFRLYCPKQYEADALYVFTPDLMALLIDEAAPFDIEIIDRWLFVYAATPFDTVSADTYRRLFRIAETVGAKALAQTERYADETVGSFAANVVSPSGQRLRRGFSVLGVIGIVIIVALWLAPNVMQFLGH